jgi:putative oxidoreductase
MTATTSPLSPAASKPGKGLNIALWVVQILLAAMFVMAGGSKLAGDPKMVGLFDVIGIGQWFRYLTGTLEVAGALLLVVPRTKAYGAALLAPVMAGAILTHLVVLHNSPAMPLVLLVGIAFVLWGRRDALLALVRGRAS